MKFEKQKRYMAKQKQAEMIERKKCQDRLRYLLKKEATKQLSAAQKREKCSLQNTV